MGSGDDGQCMNPGCSVETCDDQDLSIFEQASSGGLRWWQRCPAVVLDNVIDRLEADGEVLDHRRFQLNILDSYIGHHPLTSRRKAWRNRPGSSESRDDVIAVIAGGAVFD